MSRPPQILVPIDLSPWTSRVVDTATSIAEVLGATLHLFHVDDSDTGPKQALLQNENALSGERAMQFFRAYAPRLLNVKADYDVRFGKDVVAEILKKAHEIEDLFMVIMATHGHTGDLKKLMGHVPRQIIQASSCPILLTRKNMNIPIELKRILVPLDGSAQPATVVPKATRLAELSGGEVELFHVIEARLNPTPDQKSEERLSPPRYMDHPQHDWSAWEHEFLERFAQPRKHTDSNVPVKLFMGHGEVSDAILKFAKQHHSDLIAVGWSGVLEDNRAKVLQTILLESECPLLVHHTIEPEGGETQQEAAHQSRPEGIPVAGAV